MNGLMSYLVGEGRRNEHTEPHLVGGDRALMAWYADSELDKRSAQSIARHLNRPYKNFDTEIPGGHVWHCSLSVRSDEGMLGSEKWGEIANDFIAAMEFDSCQGTKAECRWVGVHHGVSGNGNDHIHLVVNLVREDGTKASTHNDFRRAQKASRALEIKYGLEELESVKVQRATKGYNPAEREASARKKAWSKYENERKSSDQELVPWRELNPIVRQKKIVDELKADGPRYVLSLKVRASAQASVSEAEFVRRLRKNGLLVRPRFADGHTDIITGYSVAQRPINSERPIWYGGGRLAKDLTLPRLREQWEDGPQLASQAAAEWLAAHKGQRVVSPGRERLEPGKNDWVSASNNLASAVDRLRQIDVNDHETWASVAREVSGTFASWSVAVESTPGDLAAAAAALSKSAQTYRPTKPLRRFDSSALTQSAALLACATRGGQGLASQILMIKELIALSQAIYKANLAASQARQARALYQDTRVRLLQISRGLKQVEVKADKLEKSRRAQANLDPELLAVMERVRASRAPGGMSNQSVVPREHLEPAKGRRVGLGPRKNSLER